MSEIKPVNIVKIGERFYDCLNIDHFYCERKGTPMVCYGCKHRGKEVEL